MRFLSLFFPLIVSCFGLCSAGAQSIRVEFAGSIELVDTTGGVVLPESVSIGAPVTGALFVSPDKYDSIIEFRGNMGMGPRLVFTESMVFEMQLADQVWRIIGGTIGGSFWSHNPSFGAVSADSGGIWSASALADLFPFQEENIGFEIWFSGHHENLPNLLSSSGGQHVVSLDRLLDSGISLVTWTSDENGDSISGYSLWVTFRSVTVKSIPEPSALGFTAIGMIALGMLGRRR